MKHVLTLDHSRCHISKRTAQDYISAVRKSPRDPRNVPALETNEFPTSHLKIKTTEQNQWFPTLTFSNPYIEAQHVQQTECGAFLMEAVVCLLGQMERAGEQTGALPTLGFPLAPWWIQKHLYEPSWAWGPLGTAGDC